MNSQQQETDPSASVVNFRIQPRTLLAGMTGVCRINSFEKSRHGRVVYIDLQKPDGSYIERFARFWPLEIAFAPLDSQEFEVYTG